MASGVEMLGQMSETDALAGPVQGGNMVVKPNEVPVGGAAMLAKAMRGQANKGVGGIYELPSQQQPIPQFMQMAQQGVNNDMTRMTRMIEAEAPPGEMLAYINPEEAGILQMLGGSGDIQPTTGIPSFRPGYEEDKGADAQAFKSKYSGGSTSNQDQQQSLNDAIAINDRKNAYQSMADVGISSLAGTTTDNKLGRQAEQKQRDAGFTPYSDAAQDANKKEVKIAIKDQSKSESKVKQLEKQIKKLKKDGKSTTVLEKQLSTEQDALTKIMEQIKNQQTQIAQQGNVSDKFGVASDKLKKKLKDLGILGPEIKNITDLPAETQTEMMKLLNDFERVSVSPKEALSWQSTMGKSMSDGEFRDDEDGKDTDKLTLEGLTKRLRGLDTGGGASALESLKKYDPQAYFKAFGAPQTSGGLEDFSMSPLATGDKLTKEQQRYNNAIFSAREQSRERNSNNQNNRPRFMEQTQEEVIDTPDGVVDEESQTMKYTSPRTGGTETSVPLQRRFRTDPTQDVARYRTTPRTEADILNYATQGTTGEGIGLEPFSEYQRRRRKALGLEELGLFN